MPRTATARSHSHACHDLAAAPCARSAFKRRHWGKLILFDPRGPAGLRARRVDGRRAELRRTPRARARATSRSSRGRGGSVRRGRARSRWSTCPARRRSSSGTPCATTPWRSRSRSSRAPASRSPTSSTRASRRAASARPSTSRPPSAAWTTARRPARRPCPGRRPLPPSWRLPSRPPPTGAGARPLSAHRGLRGALPVAARELRVGLVLLCDAPSTSIFCAPR